METFTLREYLNQNYLNDDSVVADFHSKFGVNVSKFENYFLFKYDQILANWNDPIVKECRGTILQKNETWEYVSIPFSKFFNLQEGRCEIFSFVELKLVEKIDGSCIQVWFDGNNWRASTLGSIQTANVFDWQFTFSELFWKIFNNSGLKKEMLIPGYTYIFELWSKYNQVVTRYSEEKIVLLAIRNNKTFSLTDFSNEQIQKMFGFVHRPIFLENKVGSKEELISLVEELAKDEVRFGKIPEGFVGYVSGRPVCKIKNEKYCQTHRILTGDKAFVLKNVVASVFCGNVDDIYGDLTDELKEFVDRLKEKIRQIIDQLNGVSYQLFLMDNKFNAKEYALKVQELTNNELLMFRGFLFDKKKEICETGNMRDLFLPWIVNGNRYEKNLDFWRNV